MTVLFGPKGPNAVESEGKHEAVFVSDADVEGVKLDGKGAAIVRVSEGVKR